MGQDTTAGNCTDPFILGYKQSCILSLIVTGSTLQKNIIDGPTICQQGNTSLCYQPNLVSNCAVISTGFNQPNGIGIINGFAYVANFGDNTVTQCTIDPSTGLFSNCTSTGSGFVGPAGQIGFS